MNRPHTHPIHRSLHLLGRTTLAYTASYLLLRAAGFLVHLRGTFFHDVAASSPIYNDLLNRVFLPLLALERTAWEVFQPR